MAVNLSSNPPPDNISGLTSSLESLTLHDTPREADCKIAKLKARVLETIRNHFPITTLFTPELKIDLGVFINDQMLFRKIAEFLAALPQTGPVDKDSIARHFEKSGLLVEIKALFKEDPTPYLASLYEACADVLNKKLFSEELLKSAIEGRIFTLKNALVAQHSPNTIARTQAQCKIVLQKVETIKEGGQYFIRECISIYALKEPLKPTFKQGLTSTAEQLIPFVQNSTKIYLREHGKDCPDTPLSFRNPSGYNHHGLTSATIMESCLHVLGYKTRVMVRSDLDPKVTLATAHSIVEVTATDASRYVVDPTYIQFHKDVCEEALLPTAPVLVLREDEVDTHIEEKLMVHFVQNAELVKKGVESVRKKLSEQDQIIPFIIDRLGIPPEYIPSNPEEWVRGALKRVWDVRTYSPILSNRGFQEIFVDAPSPSKTHEYIKAMGISSLSPHLPDKEVERRLALLLHNPRQNSPEALSLIAHLPSIQRENYASLLDPDPRIKVIGVFLNAYFRSLKKFVNPQGKDVRVIHACSGADCISVMLATDAQECTFVDLTPISYQEFELALTQLKDPNPFSEFALCSQLEQSDSFLTRQFRNGGAISHYCDGKQEMKDLALKFFFNLRGLGVDLNKVVLSTNNNEIHVDFPWQYHGASSSRNRTVILVCADITNPKSYPDLLKAKMENKFDIFYMKAAFRVPLYYPQFLPHIAKSIRKGGWLMTADKTFMMEEMPPEKCLEQNGLTFALQGSEEKQIFEGLMIPPFDPLCTIPSLEFFHPHERYMRTPGSDQTYWSVLNLRKRMV